jgi:NADH-quinone oxidoreductase subunit I
MNKGANAGYWQNIREGISSSLTGLRLTFKHLWQARRSQKQRFIASSNYFEQQSGIVTLQYPKEQLPVPEVGRYQLHNEMDDCIVCDKCAKICPVDCIDIEPIRATEEIGKTSDGTSKRIYAAKFDIDMAKCCFCGLCTTVCPTECLTMTDEYDFSVLDLREMNFAFATLSPEEAAEKRNLLDIFLKEKEAAKQAKPTEQEASKEKSEVKSKITFKPKVKDTSSTEALNEEPASQQTEEVSKNATEEKPKSTFRPKIKTKSNSEEQKSLEQNEEQLSKEKPSEEKPSEELSPEKKPAFRPKIKPSIKKKDTE